MFTTHDICTILSIMLCKWIVTTLLTSLAQFNLNLAFCWMLILLKNFRVSHERLMDFKVIYSQENINLMNLYMKKLFLTLLIWNSLMFCFQDKQVKRITWTLQVMSMLVEGDSHWFHEIRIEIRSEPCE